MTYTYHKRKELNGRFRSLFPDLIYREDRSGTPYLYVERLPAESVPLESPHVLKKVLPQIPRAWDSVVPVFIPVADMMGRGLPCWMVNYANCGEESLACLRSLMADRHICYIPSLKIKKERR